MTLFVDTSVWALALRRDRAPDDPEVGRLRDALADGEPLHTTGIVLQELLQGYGEPKARSAIVERFAALPLITPNRSDHVDAAGLRHRCRREGVQVGTIDALLAQLCIHHDLVMLSTDRDFTRIAARSRLRLWQPDA